MIELKDLLLKSRNIFLSQEIKNEQIRKIISDAIGITLESKNVKIKNGVIYLNIKPIYKNEVFLKKNKILLELEKNLGKKSPTDIR
ncbi:MAG: hypothetical protein AAB693_00415 [Patescibacteria group bacterium]